MDTENQKSYQLNKIQEKIADIEVAMLTTLTKDERLVSRPMSSAQMDSEGNIWFITSRPTAKVEQINADQDVNLAYSDPEKNTYVSISGKALVVESEEKKKELWSPILKAWFPQGLDDPNITLIKVAIDSAEYWDDTSSKMAQLFQIGKAIVTGKQYHSGENASFDVSR